MLYALSDLKPEYGFCGFCNLGKSRSVVHLQAEIGPAREDAISKRMAHVACSQPKPDCATWKPHFSNAFNASETRFGGHQCTEETGIGTSHGSIH
jgi:aerobic-type carbon monoxide dehydrogenase small subunit (CoxS/CutS family)